MGRAKQHAFHVSQSHANPLTTFIRCTRKCTEIIILQDHRITRWYQGDVIHIQTSPKMNVEFANSSIVHQNDFNLKSSRISNVNQLIDDEQFWMWYIWAKTGKTQGDTYPSRHFFKSMASHTFLMWVAMPKTVASTYNRELHCSLIGLTIGSLCKLFLLPFTFSGRKTTKESKGKLK